MKVSIFKKLKLYFQYRKAIRGSKSKLISDPYNLRIDRADRLYTVVNVPNNDKVKKEVETYGEGVLDSYVREYLGKVDPIFRDMGLTELVGLIRKEKVAEGSYLIVFGFSLFDTVKLWRRIFILSGLVSLVGLYYLLF